MKARSHKVLRARKAEGQRIDCVYDCDQAWKEYPSGITAPGSDRLFNFDMPLGKKESILVLDNYGDELLPRSLRRPLRLGKLFANTIGIHRTTGEILNVSFIEEPGVGWSAIDRCPCVRICGTFWRFDMGPNRQPMRVPARFLKRLDELKSKKRPFFLTLAEGSVFEFMTRWASYEDLRHAVVVDLYFDGARLQVWGSDYREVGNWQDGSDPQPKRAKRK